MSIFRKAEETRQSLFLIYLKLQMTKLCNIIFISIKQMCFWSHYLLKDVLVIYILEHCDETGQLILHLVFRHPLCRFLQQIVTVFSQLDRESSRGGMGWVGQDVARTAKHESVCVCTHKFWGFADGLRLPEVHYRRQSLWERKYLWSNQIQIHSECQTANYNQG